MRTAAIWMAAAVMVAAFVAFTSIGPVAISFGWRHGIHHTDLAVLVAAAGVATVLTRRSKAVDSAAGASSSRVDASTSRR